VTVWLEVEGKKVRVDLPAEVGGAMACLVDGREVTVDVCWVGEGVLSLVLEGRQYRFLMDGDGVVVRGRRYGFREDDPRSLAGRRGGAEGADGPRAVKAPMPGRVVRVLVEVGAVVEMGDGVAVIEAMKMQNELKAPKAGRVVRVGVAVGDTVGQGAVLVVIE
jgi:biotin carboxyl carrier protein